MENMLIYSVKEVAKILHTSPNYVYSLIEKDTYQLLSWVVLKF